MGKSGKKWKNIQKIRRMIARMKRKISVLLFLGMAGALLGCRSPESGLRPFRGDPGVPVPSWTNTHSEVR